MGTIFTSITNASGAEKHFGWIPPHGRTLTAGQVLKFSGIIESRLNIGKGKSAMSPIETAYRNDVVSGDAVIGHYETTGGSSSSYTG